MAMFPAPAAGFMVVIKPAIIFNRIFEEHKFAFSEQVFAEIGQFRTCEATLNRTCIKHCGAVGGVKRAFTHDRARESAVESGQWRNRPNADHLIE
jgi:hypothetical protein